MVVKPSSSHNTLCISGWKEVSLVDVIGNVSFTIWTCHCNFRCPWCGNFHIARGYGCKRVTIEEIVRRLKEVEKVIDYLHVTGGEPTLQSKPLEELFRVVINEASISNSIDTNGSDPNSLERLIPYIDHIAIDIKAPLSDPYKYSLSIGLPLRRAVEMIPRIIRSIELASKVRLAEFRTTLVPGIISDMDIVKIGRELESILGNRAEEAIFVVQQYIPYDQVPDEVLRSMPRAPPEKVREIAETLTDILSMKVFYRTIEWGTRRASGNVVAWQLLQ